MHSRFDLILENVNEEEGQVLAAQAAEIAQRLEKIGDRFEQSSEISAVNAGASGGWVQTGEELKKIVELCKGYYKSSLGCFDICIQSNPYRQGLPDMVETGPAGIRFLKDGIRLDLSGMLKGYTLDRIREEMPIGSAILNFGNSSIMATGNAGKTINLQDGQCLTTSGNDTPDRKHIINPSTGELMEGQKKVSVTTKSATLGEILSTSLFLATAEKREKLQRAFMLSSPESDDHGNLIYRSPG